MGNRKDQDWGQGSLVKFKWLSLRPILADASVRRRDTSGGGKMAKATRNSDWTTRDVWQTGMKRSTATNDLVTGRNKGRAERRAKDGERRTETREMRRQGREAMRSDVACDRLARVDDIQASFEDDDDYELGSSLVSLFSGCPRERACFLCPTSAGDPPWWLTANPPAIYLPRNLLDGVFSVNTLRSISKLESTITCVCS